MGVCFTLHGCVMNLENRLKTPKPHLELIPMHLSQFNTLTKMFMPTRMHPYHNFTLNQHDSQAYKRHNNIHEQGKIT